MLNKKQIQINNLLETCQSNEPHAACLDMQGRRKEPLQVLMTGSATTSFRGAALDFHRQTFLRKQALRTRTAAMVITRPMLATTVRMLNTSLEAWSLQLVVDDKVQV